jgi:hypothetical protein
MRPARFVAGVTVWLAVAGGVASFALARSAELRPPAERVLRYALHRPAHVEVRLEAAHDEAGWTQPVVSDPVLAGDERTFVGSVVAVDADPAAVVTPTYVVRIALDPEYDARDLEGASWGFATASGDAAWIVETLLPPKKWDLVRSELAAYSAAHSEEIGALLRPIGDQVMEHATRVLDENLTPTLKRHEKEIDALLDRYRGSLKDDLLPVLKEQLGPSAKEKAKPILTKIGRECWDALPMWQGSWAWVKAKLPFQKEDYVDEWWRDFLETKAIPILKEHEDELVKAGEDLVREGFKDPKVRAAFKDELKRVASDPEFKALLRTIIEEALVRPFDVAKVWAEIAQDPRNKEHWRSLQRTLSPVMKKVARDLAVEIRPDGREGLSPAVSRILRRIVLNKDARWVSVTTARPLVALTAGG